MSGLLQDRRMHLMADQYKTRRQRVLSKNTRLRAEAEISHQSKYQYELRVLLYAAERGLDWTGLDGQLALALAKAARDTLIAEEVMDRRIDECRSLLSTLEDSKDDAKGRVLEASYQVDSVVNYLKRMGLQEPPPLFFWKKRVRKRKTPNGNRRPLKSPASRTQQIWTQKKKIRWVCSWKRKEDFFN